MLSVDLPRDIEAVVIGGSSGAIQALQVLLPAISESTRVPIAIVVHVPARRPSLLVELFSDHCKVPVGEPLDKQMATRGVWFAPPDYHLLIEEDKSFSLALDTPVNYSRPSIDVLFETAAAAYGAAVAGIVLSGGNEDGAKGAKAIRDAGGFVLVQEPQTAENSMMPQAAISAATPQFVGDLEAIAKALAIITKQESS